MGFGEDRLELGTRVSWREARRCGAVGKCEEGDYVGWWFGVGLMKARFILQRAMNAALGSVNVIWFDLRRALRANVYPVLSYPNLLTYSRLVLCYAFVFTTKKFLLWFRLLLSFFCYPAFLLLARSHHTRCFPDFFAFVSPSPLRIVRLLLCSVDLRGAGSV